jgi:hypothetical protein
MMGERHEMSDHGLFSYPILEDDLLEYKEHLEDNKLAPFDMKREEWKGWKVVNSAWWVAIGETRFDHFRAVCGGDEDAADLLMPIVMSNRGGSDFRQDLAINSKLTQTLTGSFDKTTTTDMSEGMTYLNEGFVMFYSGVAPDCLGSGGGKEVMQDIREVGSKPRTSTLSRSLIDALLQAKKKDRTNGTNIWVDPPEGYKWLTGNLVGFLVLGRWFVIAVADSASDRSVSPPLNDRDDLLTTPKPVRNIKMNWLAFHPLAKFR